MKADQEPGRLSPRQIVTAMSGLVIAMLLAMLDNMIVAPALPTIVGELGGLNHLAWVATGYVLASTVATPIWGKLGDLFGRRITFVAAVSLFLIGSALCGVTLALCWITLAKLPKGTGKAVIDWWGTALLTVWITALVLITSWGGTQYEWTSPQILILAALAVVGFVAFVIVQRRAAEPIMPL